METLIKTNKQLATTVEDGCGEIKGKVSMLFDYSVKEKMQFQAAIVNT